MMNVKKLTKLLVYRCAEKGFEILMIPENNPETGRLEYKFPKGLIDEMPLLRNIEERIQLHYANPKEPNLIKPAIAVEGDYENVPSLLEEMKNDVKYAKEKAKEYMPDFDKWTFVSLKEAVRKILPYEYELLKELKDIISDRNVIQNI